MPCANAIPHGARQGALPRKVRAGPVAATLRRLVRVGWDSEDSNLACLVRGAGLSPAPATPEALAAAFPIPEAARDILSAKSFIVGGTPERAVEALGRPGLRAQGLPARTWLGQALLLTGRWRQARVVLDAAVKIDAGYPWSWFFRGAARLALGDAAGARADARAFEHRGGGPAGAALEALAQSSQKRWEPALAALARAARLRPSRSWPRVLTAEIRRASGDLPGARIELEKIARRWPGAKAHLSLARVYETLGMIKPALASAGRAVKLERSLENVLEKARLHASWREYDEAVLGMTEALRLLPGDPDLHFERSRTLAAAGRPAAALTDARIAARRKPDATRRYWLCQAEIINGRGLRLPSGLDASDRAFLQGYSALKDRRLRTSAAFFDKSRSLAGSETQRLRSGFYASAAALLQGPAPAPEVRVILAGLGVNPPYSATAEALRALSGCDVIYNNIPGAELADLLYLLAPRLRPLAYHQERDEDLLCRRMLAAASPGRVVGFATRGNALIYGPLGARLIALCRSRGIEWRCMPAVSSADLIDCLHGAGRRRLRGGVVLDGDAVVPSAQWNAEVGLTVYFRSLLDRTQWSRFCRLLIRRYGPARPCLIFDHKIVQEPSRLPLAGLRAHYERLGPSALLHVLGRDA